MFKRLFAFTKDAGIIATGTMSEDGNRQIDPAGR